MRISPHSTAVDRRRCYAVAIYTAMRLSELERLDAADVDLLVVPRGDGGHDGASGTLKRDIEAAKLTRPDLSRDDAEHMPFTFHGLRHTCITHWTVAGRDQLLVFARARMRNFGRNSR